MSEDRALSLPAFLRWCTAKHIQIDPRIELRVSPLGELTVFTRDDVQVGVGESLATIPKSAIFSMRSCSWPHAIPQRSPSSKSASGEDATLDLSLALLLETLTPNSPWEAYLVSLPQKRVDIVVFWGVDDWDKDGREAREWVTGTEVERLLGGSRLLGRINDYWDATATRALRSLGLQEHDDGRNAFYRAYALVSSRAFLVDAFHGLAMVPVADAFNHAEDNHVHLERVRQSDYHVCVQCGSLGECAHDGSDQGLDFPAVSKGDNEEETCEMVTRAPIGPGEEVFNSYEHGLTNAELLVQYGFALEANEHNVVRWSVGEVLGLGFGEVSGAVPPRARGAARLWAELVAAWPRWEGWDADEGALVYNQENDNSDGEGVPRQPETQLLLNADAQISHTLWLLLGARVLAEDGEVAPDEAKAILQRVAAAQARTGLGLTAREGDALRKIAAAAAWLCDARLGTGHHLAGLEQAPMADLLDSAPKLTRLGLGHALEERQLLDSSRRGWMEVYMSNWNLGQERQDPEQV